MESALHKLLKNALPLREVDAILKSLEPLSPPDQKEAADAGLILSDFSTKAAIEYFRVVHQVLRWISPDELGGWVGMGIVIAQAVSALGIRYFREGPALLSKIADRSARDQFLQVGILLARQNPNLAMEYYRQAPVFLTEVTTDSTALTEWAQHGFALGDHTLAVEYFRITPSLLKTLSIPMLPFWVGVAKSLAVEKLFHAITFMRTSPEIFSKTKTDSLPMLTFLGLLSDHSAEWAMTCFQQSSEILVAIPASLKESLMRHVLSIAQFDLQEGMRLFLNAPKILKETGPDSFLPWITDGIELLKKGTTKGYFTLESKAAKERANQFKGGIFLCNIEKVLQLFAEALCGRPVKIKPTTGAEQTPTTDGRIIYLPPHIKLFEDNAQNFEWYKIATAFQAGYLEFGTFSPSLPSFLGLFPKPDLIKKIFDIAEGARVEFLLQKEYPGLVNHLRRMREEELAHRPVTAGLLPHECVVEFLYQISLSGRTKESIPKELSKAVFDACLLLGAVQSTEGTVNHSMKAATAVYNMLDDGTLPPSVDHEMEPLAQQGEKVKGKGIKSGDIRPPSQGTLLPQGFLANQGEIPQISELQLSTRGRINPELVENKSLHPAISPKEKEKDSEVKKAADTLSPSDNSFIYDEWNCETDDYRPGFCHVTEKAMAAGEKGEAFTEGVLAEYGGAIKSIKRGFQFLAPEAYLWMKGEVEGEQFDFNRLVENRCEAKKTLHPSDRVYMQRQKKQRSVSTLFLLDISGSTEQRLEGGKSILQIEKEALILLANAIDTVGDRFALYGFSGRGNRSVLFYTLKDFQTRYTREINFRIGSAVSLGQNRDGAAIRHAVSKLSRETAKTKILVVISDGKPMDDRYTGSYAIADTKMALIEARRKKIHPFCITVDQQEHGSEYLKGMYGTTAYLVMDKIESLPTKLPRIYKRLTT
ncbi:MAG: VWA domain-containing protein [Nitrospirae bacterium]|nr:VWA domain-containing protein [Candidatus Troglogloeales bacterium]